MVKIGLSKIPSGNVYVRIKERWIRDVRNIIKKSNTILPKSTKDQLYRIENKNKVSLYFIKKFLINFEIPMEEFEKEIENITSARSTEIGIKKPKFPLNFETKEGARFIAAIMGDGELNKQLNVRYNNKEKQLINLVLKSAKMLFGKIDYKIYLRDDGTYQLHFPKIIGIIVSLLGIKPG
ncbi:MAG: hypothetical protein Q8O89_07215, partial [Nanoarchaeota archaeon]|nr:hypothetical protein [Nanoarchaeota archaeon]